METDDLGAIQKLKDFREWMVSEEIRYKADYTDKYQQILMLYLNNGAGGQLVAPIGATRSSSCSTCCEMKYQNRADLLPDALSKQATLLKFLP